MASLYIKPSQHRKDTSMGYSKLTYDKYLEDIDFFLGDLQLQAPQWADELSAMGFESVCAIDFYEDIFGEDLAPHRLPADCQSGEYSAIALEITDKGKERKAKRIYVQQDLIELIDLIEDSDNFCLVAPVSYAGKKRTNNNARFLYALCIEIDGIQPKHGLEELFYSFERKNRQMLRPTYIVCSGTGLHLYVVFERPIPLFKNVFEQLNAIKSYLTTHLWDKPISKLYDHVQYESLCQAFRCVGTHGKNKNKIAMAFKTGEKWTIEKMNEVLPEDLRMNAIYKSDLPLEKAKELYPEWYQRRIVEGKKPGHYNRYEGIYYNWIEKMKRKENGAKLGHRYNCLENLCSLAVQCQIPPEQVEKDCRELAEYLETMTESEDNHFTEYDVLCALRTYHTASQEAYTRRIDYISKKTGILLTPNKRNGRKQTEHIRLMNFVRDELNNNKNWRNKDGAPTKQEIVKQWRLEHPEGKKVDCERDTGLSRHTVLKWWDA